MVAPRDIPDQPLISVVMPVYNAAPSLAESIGSILAQTYPHFEFIIVDDGSTDGSASIVREFALRDARIRPIFLPHHGRARAKNAGLALATGAFIAWIDSDDVALPERFAVQLDWMRLRGVEACGSCVKEFGAASKVIWFPETHPAICNELLFRSALIQPSVMMHADVAKANPISERANFTDYELYTRLALRYRMGNVPQVLLKYRRHPMQVHVVQGAEFTQDLRKYRKPYFASLFPDATAHDYGSLARVADREPLPSLAELHRAGEWLVRLTQTPDNFLRQRMAERWRAACQRSAHLGLGCYRLYWQIALQFGVATESDFGLWLACALRLRSESKIYSVLASLKRTTMSRREN